MTIDRLLFAAVALALGWVFVLDDNFAANLSRTINEFPASTLNPWTAGLSAAFAIAMLAAIYREWKR
jgi:uncharacterized membrane protein YdcZ (DUF606 family)